MDDSFDGSAAGEAKFFGDVVESFKRSGAQRKSRCDFFFIRVSKWAASTRPISAPSFLWSLTSHSYPEIPYIVVHSGFGTNLTTCPASKMLTPYKKPSRPTSIAVSPCKWAKWRSLVPSSETPRTMPE